MMNANGIVQNNGAVSDFIHRQMRLNERYPILDKAREREMVERYARLKLYDGMPRWNKDHECDYEWIGDADELRRLLVMHNLKGVTSVAKKYCQETRDFDNMYAKGLFGIVRAAKEFHPFKVVVLKGGQVKYEDDGMPSFVKFNTYAHTWIFKYVIDEFYGKSVAIDKNSCFIDASLRVGNETKTGLSLENFISQSLAPEVEPSLGLAESVERMEASEMYETVCESIRDYIENSPEISAVERGVIENGFYGSCKSVRSLSSALKIPQKEVISAQTSALCKLREYLQENYGIDSVEDVL